MNRFQTFTKLIFCSVSIVFFIACDTENEQSKMTSDFIPELKNYEFFIEGDSIRVIFSDLKILTYKSLRLKDDCLDSEKNPFCQYSHYICNMNNCTFEIDNIEYLKAK